MKWFPFMSASQYKYQSSFIINIRIIPRKHTGASQWILTMALAGTSCLIFYFYSSVRSSLWFSHVPRDRDSRQRRPIQMFHSEFRQWFCRCSRLGWLPGTGTRKSNGYQQLSTFYLDLRLLSFLRIVYLCLWMLIYLNLSVTNQHFEVDIFRESVIIGNDAIFSCSVPSFVADFVRIDSWVDSEGNPLTRAISGNEKIFSPMYLHLLHVLRI